MTINKRYFSRLILSAYLFSLAVTYFHHHNHNFQIKKGQYLTDVKVNEEFHNYADCLIFNNTPFSSPIILQSICAIQENEFSQSLKYFTFFSNSKFIAYYNNLRAPPIIT